jgi:hypothetical protein
MSIDDFLKEIGVIFKETEKLSSEDEDKYYNVYQITFIDNNGFRKLHYFMMEYRMQKPANKIEIIYKKQILYLKWL